MILRKIYNSIFNIESKFETERLIFRNWSLSDAKEMFKYTKDERIGSNCGWKKHENIKESESFIKSIQNQENIFAIVLKKTKKPIGCISLMIGNNSNISLPNNQGEIGYWLGVPYWNQGIMTEAVKKIMQLGFENLKLERLWCTYFEGNDSSKKVQEKCGFKHQCIFRNYYLSPLHK